MKPETKIYNTLNTETMRTDVQAYLVQAGINVAKREGFQPESMEQMTEWMQRNRVAICEEACDLQAALLEKLTKQQDRITSIMSMRVWATVQRQELRRKEMEAYTQALEG